MNKNEIVKIVSKQASDFLSEGSVATAYNAGDPTYGVIESSFPFGAASDLQEGRIHIEDNDYYISIFSPSDRKIYVIPAFTTAPTLNATYSIYKYSKKDEYDDIFTQVFDRLSGKVLADAEYTLAVNATTITYSPPSTWKYINSIEKYKEDEVIPYPIPYKDWKIRNGNVFLNATLDPDTYPSIAFVGQLHPTAPLTATVSLEQGGIFQNCLISRMVEQFAIKMLKNVTISGLGSLSRYDTTEDTKTEVATQSSVATSIATIAGTATITTKEHTTGRVEETEEDQIEQQNAIKEDVTKVADTDYNYTSGQDKQVTWEEQEDWAALADAANASADALEAYLFERVRLNSRRL